MCKAGITPTEFHEYYKTQPSQQNKADRLSLPDDWSIIVSLELIMNTVHRGRAMFSYGLAELSQ